MYLLIFSHFLTIVISVFMTVLIGSCIIYNKINVLILIQKILLEQINIILSQSEVKRFSLSNHQKIKLSKLLVKINFDQSFCFVMKRDTVILWYKKYVLNVINEKVSLLKKKRITDYEKQMVIKIHRENPNMGYEKIRGALKNIFIRMSKSSVRNIIKQFYLQHPPHTKGNWKSYLNSLMHSLFACDFKVVTKPDGERVFILFFMSVFSRKIIHYNFTSHPSKKWIERQLRAVNDGSKIINLIADNDELFRYINFEMFQINRIKIRPFCPRMNAYIERFIGSFKREALNYYPEYCYSDDKLAFIIKEYVRFYNNFRPHQGIGNVTIPKYENGFSLPGHENDVQINKVKRMTFLNGSHSYYYLKNCA